MNRHVMKTTVATVSLIIGSLISACANSGGQYGKEPPRQSTAPDATLPLNPKVAEALSVNGSEPALVITVDQDGNVHLFTKEGIKIAEWGFPLPAGDIENMNSITMFKTSNPKLCWTMHGTTKCIEW